MYFQGCFSAGDSSLPEDVFAEALELDVAAEVVEVEVFDVAFVLGRSLPRRGQRSRKC